jgi:hypothetical protein
MDTTRTVFDVITDFLATNPTPDAILAYQLPDELEQRGEQLLERQRVGDLTFDEELEAYDFLRADKMLSLLKSKVRRVWNT